MFNPFGLYPLVRVLVKGKLRTFFLINPFLRHCRPSNPLKPLLPGPLLTSLTEGPVDYGMRFDWPVSQNWSRPFHFPLPLTGRRGRLYRPFLDLRSRATVVLKPSVRFGEELVVLGDESLFVPDNPECTGVCARVTGESSWEPFGLTKE